MKFSIKKAVRQALGQKGWKTGDLARELGINPRIFSNSLCVQKNPGIECLCRYAQALDLSLPDFIEMGVLHDLPKIEENTKNI